MDWLKYRRPYNATLGNVNIEHNLQISKWPTFVSKVYTSDYIIFLNNVAEEKIPGMQQKSFYHEGSSWNWGRFLKFEVLL